MNDHRLSPYEIATWIKFGGGWGSVASLIRRSRDEAVDRLAAPFRLAWALFLAALAPGRARVPGRPRPRSAPRAWSPAALAADCMRNGPPGFPGSPGFGCRYDVGPA